MCMLICATGILNIIIIVCARGQKTVRTTLIAMSRKMPRLAGFTHQKLPGHLTLLLPTAN